MNGDARLAARVAASTRPEGSHIARPEGSGVGAFELLGDPDAQACEGDLCAVPPAPEPDEEPAPVADEPS